MKKSFVRTRNRGFIGAIALIVGALLILQFAYHIDVLAILQSPQIVAISNFVITYSLIAWHGIVEVYRNITT